MGSASSKKTRAATHTNYEAVKARVQKAVTGGIYWLSTRAFLKLGISILCAVNLFLMPSSTAVHFTKIAPIYFMIIYIVFMSLTAITMLWYACKAKMGHDMSWSCLEWCAVPDDDDETASIMPGSDGGSMDAQKVVTLNECYYVLHWQNAFFRKIWSLNLTYLFLEIFFTAGYIIVWLGHEPGVGLLPTAKGYQQVTLWFILLGASMFIELWLSSLVFSESMSFTGLSKYQHKVLPQRPQPQVQQVQPAPAQEDAYA